MQVADSCGSGSRITQNVVSCIYRTSLADIPRLVTVNWCKTLVGQGLSIYVEDVSCQCSCKVDMKPWLFWKKKGRKTFEIGENKVDVFWDLSAAKYGSGPEPLECFFLAITSENEIVLLLGDMDKEAFRRTVAKWPCKEPTMISRREHIFGKRIYSTRAQFGESGRTHDILIECQTGGREPRLCVRVDKQLVVQVKRLMWKFRGNQTIIVDGFPVELFWDVHNWLFNPSDGHAVFMFQTCLASDKSWSSLASTASLFQWHHQSSTSSTDKDVEEPGFSLLLYAWKSE